MTLQHKVSSMKTDVQTENDIMGISDILERFSLTPESLVLTSDGNNVPHGYDHDAVSGSPHKSRPRNC